MVPAFCSLDNTLATDSFGTTQYLLAATDRIPGWNSLRIGSYTTSNRRRTRQRQSSQSTTPGVVVSVITTTGAVNESSVFLDQVEEIQTSLDRTPTCMTADAGYAYAKIYRGLEARGIIPVIPAKAELPPGPRIPMVRFKYDAKNEIVRCPRGQKLRRSTRDQDRWYYRTGFHQCRECPLRQQCLSPKVNRRTIVISNGYDALLRARRRKNRGEEEFRQIYARHRWRSEGLNAELKNRHGLHRAARRGLENMKIQSYLTASAVNLKRLAR